MLVASDQDPSGYLPTSDLFTSDGGALYGVLLSSPGSRSTSEVNGARASGWVKGQNEDFHNNAPFLALCSDKPLAAAIKARIAEALKDMQILRDMGNDADARQVAL